MPGPDALGPLLAALLAPDPSKRPVMLRPRPPYLPHPCRRLPRLRGVVRYSKGQGGAPPLAPLAWLMASAPTDNALLDGS
jgi:hypothetical protein